MANVRIFGAPQSSYTWATRMALEEKGVQHEHVVVPPHDDVLRDKHPWGKIPAFEHGDVKIFESQAIMRYVDEVFEGPSLQPEDPVARAQMNQWISAISDYVYDQAVRKLVLPRLRSKRIPVDEAEIADNLPDLRKSLEKIDAALLEKAWLAGDQMTLADIMLAPIVYYLGQVPEGERVMEGLEGIARFRNAVAERDAFKKTLPAPPSQKPK